jgi:hypothetical protein
MQTAAYIDDTTRETIRARALSYIACDVAPGLTLDEHRRALGRRRHRGGAPRRMLNGLRAAVRYPDDPVGDYETTVGGW